MTVNKNILYGILVALFIGGVGFIIQKANKEIDKNPTYRLQDRKGPLAIGAEWDSTKMYAQRLLKRQKICFGTCHPLYKRSKDNWKLFLL